jgi:hypothetical protein
MGFFLGGLLVGSSATGDAPVGRADVLLVSGQQAGALFESFDPTGCIVTDVEIDEAVTFQRQPGVGTTSINQVGISVEIINICTADEIMAADGLSTSATLEISRDLSSATLTAVLEMVDQFGLSFTGYLNLTFSAIGPLERDNGAVVSKSPGLTSVAVVADSQGREAQAVGTISLTADAMHPAMPNFVPLPSFLAIISETRNDLITVTTPK